MKGRTFIFALVFLIFNPRFSSYQMYKIDIIADNLAFPEGPAVDSKKRIWFVELKGGNLCCLDKHNLTKIPTGGGPNGIAIDSNDSIWFCDSMQNKIRSYNPVNKTFTVEAEFIEDMILAEPNDLAFDIDGHLCFTCPGNSRKAPTGYSCCILPDKTVKKIATQMFFNNGLAFTPDGKKLVIAETYKHRLWLGEWDDVSFLWKNAHPWIDVGGPIGPDGMAFDENGNLYVAVYGQQAVKCIDPTGNIIEQIILPGKNPTNCAFLPDGGLLVTEAENGQLLKISNGIFGAALFK